MRFVFLALLCGVLFLSLLLSNRFPSKEIPTSAVVHMWVLLGAHVVAAWGLQKDSFNSRTYVSFYWLAAFLSVLAAIGVAKTFTKVHPLVITVIIVSGAGILACGVLAAFIYHLTVDSGILHTATLTALTEGAALAMLSAIVFASLAANVSSLNAQLRLALGLYMAGRSAVLFAFAAGAIRNYSLWASLNNWLPALQGLLCFLLLTVFLVKAQLELSHQESPVAAEHAGNHYANLVLEGKE